MCSYTFGRSQEAAILMNSLIEYQLTWKLIGLQIEKIQINSTRYFTYYEVSFPFMIQTLILGLTAF